MNINISEKFALSFEEAACYFSIGQNKLREMAKEPKYTDCFLVNGRTRLVKREKLSDRLNGLYVI